MPAACEPADVFLVVPSLYFSGEEKLQPEISLRSQVIAFSAEFLQFLGEVACSWSVQASKKSGRAVKKRVGEKQWEERRGEPLGILTNIIVLQLPSPLPEKPFFVESEGQRDFLKRPDPSPCYNLGGYRVDFFC